MISPVLDTHVLLWWTLDPDMLSTRARDICSDIVRTGAVVSSISIWEIGIKIKRGKLDIGIDVAEYLQRLRRLRSLLIVPVDAETWAQNLNLDWNHDDPADRAIVATALMHDADLISKDSKIKAFYKKTIW